MNTPYQHAFHSLTAALILTLCASAAEPAQDNVAPEGFQSLFKGKDLAGWKEKDDKKPGHWTAEDGMIVFDGKGGEVHTVEQFSNFVLLIDFKVQKGGNSGVYLRGNTQVEINDGDSPAKPIWNGTTGGIYPDLPPLKRAAKPVGGVESLRNPRGKRNHHRVA